MNNQLENGHLPVYGVGSFYGLGVILLTIAGIVISVIGPLDSGKRLYRWIHRVKYFMYNRNIWN